MSKLTLKEIRDRIHADTYSLKNGVVTLRWGFFYTHEMTTEKKVAKVKEVFPTAVIQDSGEIRKAFRGGASVANQSHWYVKFTVPTEEKTLTRTEEIAQLLGVTIEVAEVVREEMDCSRFDYSECTQEEFNACAKASFEYLYRYMMKDEPITIVVVEKPEVIEPSSIKGLKSECPRSC